MPAARRLFSSNYAGASYAATVVFILVWLGVSSANLWVGVAQAGYTLADELPVFLLIFGLPALTAVILKWKFP